MKSIFHDGIFIKKKKKYSISDIEVIRAKVTITFPNGNSESSYENVYGGRNPWTVFLGHIIPLHRRTNTLNIDEYFGRIK